MDVLSHLFNTFRIQANVFHNGQYCGSWQLDTSGTRKASFHVVTHGQCEFLTHNGTRHAATLSMGDLVLFPRDSEHRVSSSINVTTELNTSKSQPFSDGLRDDGTGLVCGFLEFEHQSNNFLFDLLPDYMIVRSHEAPWNTNLKQILDLMITESIAEHPGVQATLNRLSEMIFMILIREKINDESQSSGFAAALRDLRIQKVLEAIHNDPAQDWTVESLAAIAAMSRSAFAAKFKSLLDETPLSYIKRWRMQSAYRWFRDDGITVAEAADRCGYVTEAAFAKAFKRELGVSPGQVRAK